MLFKKKSKFIPLQKKKIIFSKLKDIKNRLNFGNIGIKALEPGILTKKQLEALRRSITRIVKKKSKLWLRSRVNKALTAKPVGFRMGKGKGSFSQKIRFIRNHEIIFEFTYFNKVLAKLFLKKLKKKLPIRTCVVFKGR